MRGCLLCNECRSILQKLLINRITVEGNASQLASLSVFHHFPFVFLSLHLLQLNVTYHLVRVILYNIKLTPF